mmetsp:Transcript_11355/g.29036  ORF Transcript_11355/g.29036 Transcript_11355/m.29036 type:complete len:685 (-) Transcript_11355:410-2464(-)|eukprot:CAMPEP_0115857448 /NCGR_PEP_ID=MMETSP0287-20121206/15581_1 /TAXON_ID=412157 /ORGANISM="Chrysochromulina rotalis, Strain UIO044" /LENGTH=684 /DNA_ID=CAMNT_0003311669 /DNA_START=14 /DNA_END=2068 /DNA_ORIENTATION=+
MCAKTTRCLNGCRSGKSSISADELEELDSEREARVNLWKTKKLLMPPAAHLPIRNNFERLMKLLMWYTGVTVPLMAAFQIPYAESQLAIDYVIDLLFWVDIILTSRTSFYDPNNDIVTDSALIVKSYLGTRFSFDVFANIPWELLAVAAGHGHNTAVFSAWRMFRMFRFCRIYKIHKPVLVDVNDSGARQLVLYFPLMTHWTACVWWAIGWSSYSAGHVSRPDWQGGSSWLVRTPGSAATDTASQRLGDASSLAQDYLSALYWSATTLMKAAWIGPSTIGEKCFASFVVLLGAIMFAVILGQINGIIRKIDESTVQRRNKLGTFKQFCTQNKLDIALTRKVINYANAEWNVTGGVSASSAFDASKLSALLRSEMIYEMHKDLLRSSTFLQRVSMGCAKQLLTKSSTQVCLKNEFLVGYGQMARELFIVIKGALQVSIPNNVRKQTMGGDTSSRKSMSKKPNMTFRIIDRTGAITGLWKPSKNDLSYPFEIIAKEFTTMLNISRPALMDIMGNFSSTDRNEITEYLDDEHEVTMSALKVTGKRTTSVRTSKASSRNSAAENPGAQAPSEEEESNAPLTLKDAKGKFETLQNTMTGVNLTVNQLRKSSEDIRDIYEALSGITTDRSNDPGTDRGGSPTSAAQQRQIDREEQIKKSQKSLESNEEKQQITKVQGDSGAAGLTAAMVL